MTFLGERGRISAVDGGGSGSRTRSFGCKPRRSDRHCPHRYDRCARVDLNHRSPLRKRGAWIHSATSARIHVVGGGRGVRTLGSVFAHAAASYRLAAINLSAIPPRTAHWTPPSLGEVSAFFSDTFSDRSDPTLSGISLSLADVHRTIRSRVQPQLPVHANQVAIRSSLNEVASKRVLGHRSSLVPQVSLHEAAGRGARAGGALTDDEARCPSPPEVPGPSFTDGGDDVGRDTNSRTGR